MPKEQTKHFASGMLGTIFAVAGILSIIFSIYFSSQILAFLGLGLTFWGAIFILVTPQKRFDAGFFEASVAPEYATIDRIIRDIQPKGEAYCIPPYPKGGYLPEHLGGLKEPVVFIPAENTVGIAPIEDLVKGRLQVENPKGVLITPPGIGILDKIEQKPNTDLTKITQEEFTEFFPRLLQELNLTKDIEIIINGDEATLKITGSIFKNLYSQKYGLKCISFLGCPIVNAVACALAKSTGKPVAVQKIQSSQYGQSITATFKIMQAPAA